MFDAALQTQICRLNHDSPVHAVAFSPDSGRVITGTTAIAVEGSIGGARVIDVGTGIEICRMDHDHSVHAVAFSPDGNQVITASSDNGARVFDAGAGTEICYMEHDGSVGAVAFSPDGKRVITASKEGWIRFWRIDHNQLLEHAMGRLARNLTRREWRRYFYDEPYRKTRADLP